MELHKIKKSFSSYKDFLLVMAEENKEIKEPSIDIEPKLLVMLISRKEKNVTNIKKLEVNREGKDKKILSLEGEIDKLLDNKAISDQQDHIKKWIRTSQDADKLVAKEGAISTSGITRLSNKAHDNLLTEKLNSSFQKEIEQLGYTDLNVNLIKAKAIKGETSTKLVLINNKSVNGILSEGEQKAVGLALFMAETAVQKPCQPIILDDPVNSLDHRIASTFADRLLSLDNQLIVFNHNRLFQDAWETARSGHICKTCDSHCNNKKSKHILVQLVQSEGSNRKGVLLFYKCKTAKRYIDAAKQKLQKTPFTENDADAVAVSLRKAIECIVDENILQGVVPTKYSNKNNRIHWDKLKELGSYSDSKIECLCKIHGRISGGAIHRGAESENNPIDVPKFNSLVRDIELFI